MADKLNCTPKEVERIAQLKRFGVTLSEEQKACIGGAVTIRFPENVPSPPAITKPTSPTNER